MTHPNPDFEVITFDTHIRPSISMIFEYQYEKILQLSLEEKTALMFDAEATYMYVNDKLAGECYGIPTEKLKEPIEDLTPEVKADLNAIYCYSTTILPEFQGKGYSRLLIAHWNGYVSAMGYQRVYGHATSAAMVRVRASFGAKFSNMHDGWYGTDRMALFYDQRL